MPARSLSAVARRVLIALLLALFVASGAALAAAAQPADPADEPPLVAIEVLPLRGAIGPPVSAAIRDVIAQANERGSALVVVQIDTPGGQSVDAEELLDTVAGSGVPVVVYAGPRLVGAEARGLGVLLLAAAHVSGAATDVSVGPVSPVDLADDVPAEDAALVAATLAGRLPDDAPRQAAANRLLSGALTAEEAVELGLVDVVADGLEAMLVDLEGVEVTTATGTHVLRLDDVSVRFHSLGLIRRALHAAATPAFIYLMLLGGLALLIFERFQPGFGVAGIAALVLLAFGVYGIVVLPTAWWAVALVVAGMLLLGVDVALAGLGPPTVLGTAALTAGSMWLYDSPHLGVPGWLIAATVVAAVVFFVVIMTIVLRAQAGPGPEEVEPLVGKPGVVRSVLNPEGHVFVDGALWRSRWTGEPGRVAVGTRVRVHGVDGPVLLVDDAPAEADPRPDAAGSEDAAQDSDGARRS